MRKVALLIAATLVVSAPIIATSATDSFAAAKAKGKAKGMGMGAGAPAETNGGFFQAFGDQMSGGGQTTTTSKGMGMGMARGMGRKKSG